jgi:hypothetical protein
MQYVILTGTGVVTPANNAGLLIGCTITCGASAGSILFKNGGAGGTSVIQLQCAANDTVTFKFDKPIRMLSDIHATLTNVTYAYILFEQYKAG